MWAKFPADFTIWLKSVFAWGNTVVSDSYFTHWAGALVNTNTSSVCLLPAGVIFLLIPELLEVLINIVLFLSLCLLGWLSFGLFGSSWVVIVMMIIMGLVVWVMKWVMDIVMVLNSVFVMMVIMVVVMVPVMVLWVFSVNEMRLSMLGFISFMNGLWVDMMVIVVEESMLSMVETVVSVMVEVIMVSVMVEVTMVSIKSICEWVVVDGLVIVVMIVMVIISMMSSVMVISMVEVMVVIMSLLMIVVLSMNGSKFLMVVVVDVVTIVAKSMVAITVSMAIPESMFGVSVMVTEVSSPFTVVSVSVSMLSEVSEWRCFVVCSSPPFRVVWGLVMGSTPVSSFMSFMSVVVTIMRKYVTKSHVISIVVGVRLSHVVSVVSLGVLHLLSVSSNVVMIVWVWELMWVDFERSLVMFWINNTNMGSVMELIMMSESISVVVSMSGMAIIMSINAVAVVSISEMWLFVEAVLNVVAIISESSVFTMWVFVVAVVAEVVTETMVSYEHWV